MGRRTLIAIALAAACSDSDPVPIQRPDGGQTCTAGSHTCANGRCVNSYCVTACTGGTACPAGTFCGGPAFPDDLCAPIAPVSCATTTDCPVDQGCLSGHCVSLETIGDGGLELCTPGVAQDKCAPDAICYLVGGLPKCVGLPLCGADGGCPTGAISQACNLLPDGGHAIEGKGAICALEECSAGGDCRAGAVCFHAGVVPWGKCQYGITGDPCLSNADCASAATCEASDAGTPDGGDGGVSSRCKCAITTADAGVCAGQ
jgi:hypothetical protein